SMEAKVVAYALLDKKSSTNVTTMEDFIAKIEDAKNKNVIVGNWEVQNYYRYINNKDGTVILVDDDDNPILDESGNVQTVTATRSEEYSEIYTSDYDKTLGITREVYTSAWNMFQDHYVHFKSGTPIRYENIDIFDDVVLVDPNLTGSAKYAQSNIKSYGKTGNVDVINPTENGSSVQNTRAAGNGSNSNGTGYPYVWQALDSLDVDFEPEVGWHSDSIYPLQDWDLLLGYDKWGNNYVDGSGNSNFGVGAVTHTKANNSGSEKGGWSDHLRIHSTLTFKTPYYARPTYEKTTANDCDVLWVRVESEPMFRYPDSKAADHLTKNHLDILGLNSVRQIIINFTESNLDADGNEYRPIVIFYDGPERYTTTNSIRDSLPIIVNLAAPVRAVIYAPNSPVVVIGDHQNDFRGFIVAKKYLRLKTTADFEAEIENYDKANDAGTVVTNGQNYRAKEETDNPYFGTMHGTYYRDNGEPKKINWLYKKSRTAAATSTCTLTITAMFNTWN
ncbi:MAG: hypothetical protein IKN27_13545, partial [Selenomonadaceae bacterium]|nr:hypothetical protein [Selenomonadaceae bacterium]